MWEKDDLYFVVVSQQLENVLVLNLFLMVENFRQTHVGPVVILPRNTDMG